MPAHDALAWTKTSDTGLNRERRRARADYSIVGGVAVRRSSKRTLPIILNQAGYGSANTRRSYPIDGGTSTGGAGTGSGQTGRMDHWVEQVGASASFIHVARRGLGNTSRTTNNSPRDGVRSVVERPFSQRVPSRWGF